MPYNSTGLVVHDADAHIMETPNWLRDHADPAVRDRIPALSYGGINELRQTGDPHEQLREVSRRFALYSRFAPFSRCMDCNGPLRAVTKNEVAHVLPPHTRETKNEFSRCADCNKIFWRGSHHARMLGWIEELTACSPSNINRR